MTRHLRDLTSTENLLVVSSRFWFKAHMFRCNTPLILLRDVFKSSNLSTSIRDFHSLMMAIAHMTKSKLSPNYQTPVTGVAEELLIKIIMLAQRGNDEQMNDIFSKYFFEGDANHFINLDIGSGRGTTTGRRQGELRTTGTTRRPPAGRSRG